MDKKEIESPKLTGKFLIWITAFMLLLFAYCSLRVEGVLTPCEKRVRETKERTAAAKAGLLAATDGTTESRTLPIPNLAACDSSACLSPQFSQKRTVQNGRPYRVHFSTRAVHEVSRTSFQC